MKRYFNHFFELFGIIAFMVDYSWAHFTTTYNNQFCTHWINFAQFLVWVWIVDLICARYHMQVLREENISTYARSMMKMLRRVVLLCSCFWILKHLHRPSFLNPTPSFDILLINFIFSTHKVSFVSKQSVIKYGRTQFTLTNTHTHAHKHTHYIWMGINNILKKTRVLNIETSANIRW